jgi:probable phosphoglycerate mutase
VWLVRHGATTAPPGAAIGATDLPLSDEGREQARHLAAGLASRPLVRVLSSDLMRAMSTADAIAAPHHLVVEPARGLREIDFGAWEGRSLGDLWTEQPQAAKAWEKDIRSTPPTFAESLAGVQIRVEDFWLGIRPPDNGELAVVAHRCSLAVLRALITGESIEEAFSSEFEVGKAVAVLARC